VLVRRWLGVGALCLVGLLYYRPLHTYVDTRHTLVERSSQVQSLRAEKRQLEQKLADTASDSDSSIRGSASSSSRASRHGSTRSIRSGGMEDEAVVARQLGRPPRAFRRVAVRCPYGRPAVTEQWPRDATGAPFPTTYYLTCPQLVAAISRLEARGGVERWTRAVEENSSLRQSLDRANEEQRELRPELPGGIGGSTRSGSLKCLHAHAAFALARPGYELGERILAELDHLWPDSGCCTAKVV
jgi:hypothetical protein